MQKFKEADGGLSDGTAIDRDGFNAGTKLLAKFVNDNMWNIFEVVERTGYTLIDGDTSQLAKAIRAPYNASYTYNTSAIDTQSVNDVVFGSDGYYYEAQEDGVKDVDPVTDDSGKWERIGFAKLNGDKTQKFKVADAEEDDEALSKGQLLEAIKEVDENDSGINATTVNGTPKELLGIGGEGYQLVDETSNRTNDEEYTNTSQSALFVTIGVRSGDNQYVALYVGDIEVCRAGEDGISGATTDSLSAVVPQGFTYELKRSSDKDVNIDSWSELKKV